MAPSYDLFLPNSLFFFVFLCLSSSLSHESYEHAHSTFVLLSVSFFGVLRISVHLFNLWPSLHGARTHVFRMLAIPSPRRRKVLLQRNEAPIDETQCHTFHGTPDLTTPFPVPPPAPQSILTTGIRRQDGQPEERGSQPCRSPRGPPAQAHHDGWGQRPEGTVRRSRGHRRPTCCCDGGAA